MKNNYGKKLSYFVRDFLHVRTMSHEAIYRQPVPGNLQEEEAFSYDFSHSFLGDGKTPFVKSLMCY